MNNRIFVFFGSDTQQQAVRTGRTKVSLKWLVQRHCSHRAWMVITSLHRRNNLLPQSMEKCSLPLSHKGPQFEETATKILKNVLIIVGLGNLFSSCSAGTVKHQVFHHHFEAALGQRLRKEEGWQNNSCSQARLSDSSFISWRKVSQNKKQKHGLGKYRAWWNRIADHFSLCVLLSLIVQRIPCSRQSW